MGKPQIHHRFLKWCLKRLLPSLRMEAMLTLSVITVGLVLHSFAIRDVGEALQTLGAQAKQGAWFPLLFFSLFSLFGLVGVLLPWISLFAGDVFYRKTVRVAYMGLCFPLGVYFFRLGFDYIQLQATSLDFFLGIVGIVQGVALLGGAFGELLSKEEIEEMARQAEFSYGCWALMMFLAVSCLGIAHFVPEISFDLGMLIAINAIFLVASVKNRLERSNWAAEQAPPLSE